MFVCYRLYSVRVVGRQCEQENDWLYSYIARAICTGRNNCMFNKICLIPGKMRLLSRYLSLHIFANKVDLNEAVSLVVHARRATARLFYTCAQVVSLQVIESKVCKPVQ